MLNKLIKPLTIIFFICILVFNFKLNEGHFSQLANSFLEGKTYFLEEPEGGWIDTTPSRDHNFWPAGPFPIILLTPFVFIFKFFKLFFYQGYLQPLLVIIVFWFCFKVAKSYKYSDNDAGFLAYAFCFSTVFINVALWPAAWGFSQVVAVLILWLIIFGFIKKTSYWLMGILVGLAIATRFASFGVIILILADIFWFSKKNINVKLKQSLSFITTLIFLISLICLYNYVRFGNILDNGYAGQILTNENLEKARSYGLFSLIHIPGNLYYFLLSTPLPVIKDSISHVLTFPFIRANPWGMSILVTSPYFIYLFFLGYKDKLSKILILTIIVISIPIFLYYGIGFRQFGYRYSLDFLPILFFLLMRNYRKKYISLSYGFKSVVIMTSITNIYFFLTAFMYP